MPMRAILIGDWLTTSLGFPTCVSVSCSCFIIQLRVWMDSVCVFRRRWKTGFECGVVRMRCAVLCAGHRSNALSTWRQLFRYFQDDQADPGLCRHIIMGICVPLFGACFNSRRSSATDVADVEGLLLAPAAECKGSQPPPSQKNILQALMAEILAALPVHAAGTPAPVKAWKKTAAFSLLQMSVCALPRESIKGNLNAAYCGPASKHVCCGMFSAVA